MRSSTFSYILSSLSLFAAVVSALVHDFRFLLLNFFFAVFNWYLAECKRRLEDEQDNEESGNGKSDDSKTEE
jgi:hypothetical protein